MHFEIEVEQDSSRIPDHSLGDLRVIWKVFLKSARLALTQKNYDEAGRLYRLALDSATGKLGEENHILRLIQIEWLGFWESRYFHKKQVRIAQTS